MHETRHWYRVPLVPLHNASTAGNDCKSILYFGDRFTSSVLEPKVVKLDQRPRKSEIRLVADEFFVPDHRPSSSSSSSGSSSSPSPSVRIENLLQHGNQVSRSPLRMAIRYQMEWSMGQYK